MDDQMKNAIRNEHQEWTNLLATADPELAVIRALKDGPYWTDGDKSLNEHLLENKVRATAALEANAQLATEAKVTLDGDLYREMGRVYIKQRIASLESLKAADVIRQAVLEVMVDKKAAQKVDTDRLKELATEIPRLALILDVLRSELSALDKPALTIIRPSVQSNSQAEKPE